MNAQPHLAMLRGSMTITRWQAMAPLAVGAVLLAAGCTTSTPSAANSNDEADTEPEGPPAHLVLSITPVDDETSASTRAAGSPAAEDAAAGSEDGESTDEGSTDDDEDGYDWWTSSRVVLTCSPADGTHPDPGSACMSLHEAEGDFEQLPMVPGACPRIYAPVEVEALGYWDDERVDYTRTFSNKCEAATGTGSTFAF